MGALGRSHLGLEGNPLRLGRRKLFVQIEQPVNDKVLFIIQRDNSLIPPVTVQRSLGLFHPFLQLQKFLLEEFYRLFVNPGAKVNSVTYVRKRVGIGQAGRNTGIRGGKQDLDQARAADRLDLQH